MQEREFKPLNISILTISDSRTEKDDKSGKLLAERLVKSGHSVGEKRICRDNIYQIRSHVSRWISDDDINVVLTTGGTGVTGRDGSPEAVLPLLDKVLDGFGEIFRVLSYEDIGTSTLQSRTLAGVSNGTYLFVLPGSSGACALGWHKIIVHQLD